MSFSTKTRKISSLPNNEKGITIHTTRDDNGRVWDGAVSARLFFSIPKLISFKKLNGAGQEWENSQTHSVYI